MGGILTVASSSVSSAAPLHQQAPTLAAAWWSASQRPTAVAKEARCEVPGTKHDVWDPQSVSHKASAIQSVSHKASVSRVVGTLDAVWLPPGVLTAAT